MKKFDIQQPKIAPFFVVAPVTTGNTTLQNWKLGLLLHNQKRTLQKIINGKKFEFHKKRVDTVIKKLRN